MIVVDSSAVIAILQGEPDAAVFVEAIASADTALISAASVVEIGIVMTKRYGTNRRADVFLQESGLQVEAVSPQQARLAIEAYAHYGKGRKNSAGLNFGDCFSYALAKSSGLPLLYKGADFRGTDIEPAS